MNQTEESSNKSFFCYQKVRHFCLESHCNSILLYRYRQSIASQPGDFVPQGALLAMSETFLKVTTQGGSFAVHIQWVEAMDTDYIY